MPKAPYVTRDAARFGAILQRLRLQRGWSLATAARRCGMNPNHLGVLEKGGNMVGLATLLELADVYGVEASEIVREVEQARREASVRQAASIKIQPVD